MKAAGAGQEPATWVWGSLARLSGLNLDSLNLAPDNLTKQRPCGVLRRHAGNYRYSVEIAGRPRLSHICQGRVGQCQTWGPLVFQVTGADRWMGHGAGIFPYVKDQTSNRRPLSTEPRDHVMLSVTTHQGRPQSHQTSAPYTRDAPLCYSDTSPPVWSHCSIMRRASRASRASWSALMVRPPLSGRAPPP